MQKYIALLRGINVGGHRKVPMNDLKILLESLGFLNIKTYIQSGNVVFESEQDALTLEKKIESNLEKKWGFPVSVIIRDTVQWRQILSHRKDAGNLYYTFLKEMPSPENTDRLSTIDFTPDTFELYGQEVYISCENYGKTKLSNLFFENKLKVQATTRNRNTLVKLMEMSA